MYLLYCANIYDNMKAYENQGDLKRSQFRKQIRNKQIENYFEHQRFKHALWIFQEQRQDISQHMHSGQSKRQWLNLKSIELGTNPKREWFPVLKQLYIATDSINSDLEDWIRTGLIKSLTLLFRPKYRELHLFHLSACIFQQIIQYLAHQSQYIAEIVTEQIIIDLIDLCQLPEYNFFSLINSILSKKFQLSNIFVKYGLIQSLVSKLKHQKNIENQQTYIMLNALYHMIKNTNQTGIILIENDIMLQIIGTLGKLTFEIKNKNTLRIILKIFDCLTNTSKKSISTIISCENLFDFLVDLLTAQSDSMFRSLAAQILVKISSYDNFIYCQKLRENNILNRVLRCSFYQNNHEECIRNLLKIISNIAQYSFENSKDIIYHNVFQQFVLKCTKKVSSKNHTDAILTISSLIKHNSMQIIQNLIKKHQILSIFVQSLKSDAISISCAIEILKCMIQIIILYKQQNKSAQKRIISHLENIYNFTNVLEKLQQKINNQEVEQLVSIIIQLLHGQ